MVFHSFSRLFSQCIRPNSFHILRHTYYSTVYSRISTLSSSSRYPFMIEISEQLYLGPCINPTIDLPIQIITFSTWPPLDRRAPYTSGHPFTHLCPAGPLFSCLDLLWPSREVARFHFGPCDVRKGHIYVLYLPPSLLACVILRI